MLKAIQKAQREQVCNLLHGFCASFAFNKSNARGVETPASINPTPLEDAPRNLGVEPDSMEHVEGAKFGEKEKTAPKGIYRFLLDGFTHAGITGSLLLVFQYNRLMETPVRVQVCNLNLFDS